MTALAFSKKDSPGFLPLTEDEEDIEIIKIFGLIK